MPSGVCGIGLGQALGNAQGCLVASQRRRQVALGALHVADLFLGHREVALPSGVCGIGLGQALEDGMGCLVASQRRRQVAEHD